MLLADAGGERGAEEHLVHLVAGVAQAVLDEVQGDRVDVGLVDGAGRGLDDGCHARGSFLGLAIPDGRMSREPDACTVAAWPGRTRVVESISVTIAGPLITWSARSAGPVVDRGVHPAALDEDRMGVGRRRWTVAALQRDGRDRRPRPRHRRAGVDQLVVHGEQEREEPLVLGVERGRELLEVRRLHLDRDLEALPVVAHVHLERGGLLLDGHALRGEGPTRLGGELVEDRAQVVDVGEAAQHGAGRLAAGRRGRVAQRAQHARRRRHDHRPRSRQPAQGVGVQRARAAERDQGELPRDRSPAAPTPGAGRRACSR